MKKTGIILGLLLLMAICFSACNNSVPCPAYADAGNTEQVEG